MTKPPPRQPSNRASAEERQRRAANARMGRYRQRLKLKNGSGVCPTPYSNDIVALLLDLHWLAETESEDRKQIGAAIGAMVGDFAKRHKKGDA